MRRLSLRSVTLALLVWPWLLAPVAGDGEEHGDDVDSPEMLAEIERLAKQYPETSGLPRYERSGHQYTTFIVARAAGLSPKRAYLLSYFSQFPDDERRFSATLAAFYVHDLSYRKQIMAVLHSLHGGGHQAVLERRQDLAELVAEGVRTGSLSDPQIGLVIHALADSYAHVTEKDGKLQAFGYVFGHLFHGHKPDVIAHDAQRYRAYTCALFQALSGKADCTKELETLTPRLAEVRGALAEIEGRATDLDDPGGSAYVERLLGEATPAVEEVLRAALGS